MFIFSNHEIWSAISSILGWCYFLAWSCSFYPQVILNYKRKSVQGLSLDFLYFNLLGFFCYSIFNISFYSSKQIQDEYKQRNHSNTENLVRLNDVMFSVHAFLITLLTLLQTVQYKKSNSPSQQVSKIAQYFIWVSIAGIGFMLSAVYLGHAMLIDLMYYLSYVKLTISLIKYIPQAYLNYKRKSTVGWSIYNILLDFTGGSLSIAQLVIDASVTGDWSGVSGDPVKLGLGVQSIAFDVFFMIQHYILYVDRVDVYVNTVDEERRRLIVEGRVPRSSQENI